MADVQIDPEQESHPRERLTIADQNDQFRRSLGLSELVPGMIVSTAGIRAKGEAFVTEALRQVQAYEDFSADHDPCGLHEMGIMTVEGETVWWKIDLYDRNYLYGSDEPDNPEQTRRVLTILLPSEY